MSIIQPKDFLRFFEKTYDIQFMDTVTGKPALEVLQEESDHKRAKQSDFDLWLAEQDEETKLEIQMGEL